MRINRSILKKSKLLTAQFCFRASTVQKTRSIFNCYYTAAAYLKLDLLCFNLLLRCQFAYYEVYLLIHVIMHSSGVTLIYKGIQGAQGARAPNENYGGQCPLNYYGPKNCKYVTRNQYT